MRHKERIEAIFREAITRAIQTTQGRAQPNTPLSSKDASFSDMEDIRVLFRTIEELAAQSLDEPDSNRRAALLWSIQKMAKTAAVDVARMS